MELTQNEIREICSKYNIGNLIKSQKVGIGVANHNWFITTENGKFVLRCVNEDKSKKNLDSEFAYLNYLFENGFNYKLPVPIKTNNNKLYLNFNKRIIWIYPFIQGEIINDVFNGIQLEEVAMMLAQMHQIIENSNLKNIMNNNTFDINTIIEEANEQIKTSSKNNDEYSMYYTKKAKEFIDLIKQLTYPNLPNFPIHRDINPENVLFKNNKLVAVIDFDNVSSCNEPLVKDIANLFLYSCFDKNKQEKLNLKLAKKFIKEYLKTRTLTLEEIKAIPILAIMGCLEDFNYEYWLYENEPKKTDFSKLNRRFETGLWYFENKEKIIDELIDTI
jgi:homoserine kinase type II